MREEEVLKTFVDMIKNIGLTSEVACIRSAEVSRQFYQKDKGYYKAIYADLLKDLVEIMELFETNDEYDLNYKKVLIKKITIGIRKAYSIGAYMLGGEVFYEKLEKITYQTVGGILPDEYFEGDGSKNVIDIMLDALFGFNIKDVNKISENNWSVKHGEQERVGLTHKAIPRMKHINHIFFTLTRDLSTLMGKYGLHDSSTYEVEEDPDDKSESLDELTVDLFMGMSVLLLSVVSRNEWEELLENSKDNLFTYNAMGALRKRKLLAKYNIFSKQDGKLYSNLSLTKILFNLPEEVSDKLLHQDIATAGLNFYVTLNAMYDIKIDEETYKTGDVVLEIEEDEWYFLGGTKYGIVLASKRGRVCLDTLKIDKDICLVEDVSKNKTPLSYSVLRRCIYKLHYTS